MTNCLERDDTIQLSKESGAGRKFPAESAAGRFRAKAMAFLACICSTSVICSKYLARRMSSADAVARYRYNHKIIVYHYMIVGQHAEWDDFDRTVKDWDAS